jgi:hypothetical protein
MLLKLTMPVLQLIVADQDQKLVLDTAQKFASHCHPRTKPGSRHGRRDARKPQSPSAWAKAIEAIGGDGFLISTPFQRISRRYINEVCEGLVPALQRRGLVRTAYTRSTLRENLREF